MDGQYSQWCRDVIVEEVRDGVLNVEYPIFVDEARHSPQEDIGRPFGPNRFDEALAPQDMENMARRLWR